MLNNTHTVKINSEGRITRADANRRKVQAERVSAAKSAAALDVQRAENLRRSRAIANIKPGTGPRIAR